MWSEDERSGVAVQLCRSRDSSARKSSASNDSGDRERGPGGARRRFFGALFPDVTTFDPTEKLLRAMLLQAAPFAPLGAAVDGGPGVRPLVPLVRRIGVEDAAWDHSTFSENRGRLLEGDVAAKLLNAVLSQPRMKRLLSSDHFSVDGTLMLP
jgi:hypothetical protein